MTRHVSFLLVPFDEDEKDPSVWFLDHDYLENMYGMFKKVNGRCIRHYEHNLSIGRPGGGGVLPYMGYIGMCGAKEYGFSAVSVINRV